jgi:hypothetical protein
VVKLEESEGFEELDGDLPKLDKGLPPIGIQIAYQMHL